MSERTAWIYYLTTAADNFQPRYVGQTKDLNLRLRGHHVKRSTKCSSWVTARVREGFKIEICPIEHTDIAHEREKFWIKNFKDQGHDLLNLTLGGEFGPVDDEARQKISNKVKAAIKANGGHWQKGKKIRPRSEITRQKMSLSAKARVSRLGPPPGKSMPGGDNPRAVGTRELAATLIKEFESTKITRKALAEKYNLTYWVVAAIIKRKHWSVL